MPRIVVSIKWDRPEDEFQLTPDIISNALHSYYPDTNFINFKVTYVSYRTVLLIRYRMIRAIVRSTLWFISDRTRKLLRKGG